MLKVISILGLVVMIGALVGLYKIGVLFTAQPIAIALQLMAVALMIWARITFGRRSFHAAANATAGGLVTTGPYRPNHKTSNLYRSMSLWLGCDRCTLVFGKRRVGTIVATRCASANDM